MTAEPWAARLGEFIRARRTAAQLSLRELALRANVSNAYLSQIERGQHEPSLTVLMAIADGLGLPPATLLAQAGVLGEAGTEIVDTATAILRDPALTEPQRIALLSVYRSFVPGS